LENLYEIIAQNSLLYTRLSTPLQAL